MSKKVSIDLSNRFCPQTLFLYGTYKEDGAPDFGLFCWFSYCWDKELHVMACIGGEKLTKDNIRRNKVFSANLVSQPMLPLADYLGCNEGYDGNKMTMPLEIEPGHALPVPILKDSPWVYELEVAQTISLDDSEVYICKIHNVLADEVLIDECIPLDERMKMTAPVMAAGIEKYFFLDPTSKGSWGEWKSVRKE